jgi:signal transduction histidine kinase
VTTGAQALGLRGRRSGTQGHPLAPPAPTPGTSSAPENPQRSTVVLLLVARAVTALAIAGLLVSSEDVDWPLAVGLAVALIVEMAGSAWWLLRSADPARSPVLLPALAIDMVLWLGICWATGRCDSPVLLLALVLPSIGALVLNAGWLLGGTVLVMAARVVIGGPTEALLTFCLFQLWGVAIGSAASRGRRVFAKRIRRLDEVWTAIAGGHGPSEMIRERVADDLRRRALEPVLEVREACAAGVGADDLASLNGRMSTIIARTRAIAHELHAPAALHGGVEESIRHVARVRAPAAEIVVRIVGDVPADFAEPLDAVVRDALGIVAGAWTREVVVELEVDADAARIGVAVTATPMLDFDGDRRALRHSALAARAEVSGVDVTPTEDGGGRVELRLRDVAPLELSGALETRQFRELGTYVATVRLGAVPLLGVGALLIGGTDPGFWWVYAAFAVDLVGFALFMRRWGSPSRWPYAVSGVLDAVLITGGFALAGDAQAAFVAVTLMVPVTNAPIYPWPMILAVTTFVAAAIALTAPQLPQPAVTIALAWAAAIALIESSARDRDARRFFVVARRRNELLRGLLQEEEDERRRLAGQLHDDVLQRLFVVRQDLEEAAEEDSDGTGARQQALAGLDGVVAVLTRTVGDLDVDEGATRVAGGLRAALETTTALRDGPDVDLEIDEGAAGVNDGLVVQLVRELYTNVSSRTGAERMRIGVLRQPGALVLDVVDDGKGPDWGRPDDWSELSTVRARTRHLGGSILLGDAPGGGLHVQIRLPVAAAAPAEAGSPGAPSPVPR